MTVQKQKLLINATFTKLTILSTDPFLRLQVLLRCFNYCRHFRCFNLSLQRSPIDNFNSSNIPIIKLFHLSQPWTLHFIAALVLRFIAAFNNSLFNCILQLFNLMQTSTLSIHKIFLLSDLSHPPTIPDYFSRQRSHLT